MKRLVTILSVFFLVLAMAVGAQALTMSGPILTDDLFLWPNSGLSITAMQDVYLTSFIFQNRGHEDTVYLEDSSSNVIGSYHYVGGDTSHLINVSWFMQAGQTYHLLSTEPSNGRWTSYTAYPTDNAEIQVNGVWGYEVSNSSSYLIDSWWFNFNDITTSANAVPIPGAVWLLGSGLLGLAGLRRFRKS